MDVLLFEKMVKSAIFLIFHKKVHHIATLLSYYHWEFMCHQDISYHTTMGMAK